jgi:rhodanese-related sulfurtransferase
LLLFVLQVRSVDVKEALRLQKENNFVILDVRPEAEFKEVYIFMLFIVTLYFYSTVLGLRFRAITYQHVFCHFLGKSTTDRNFLQ